MSGPGTFPKSVTQSRLEQHEQQFERMNAELGKSKKAGQTAASSLLEQIGEMRFELEALEGQERETRMQSESNRDSLETANGAIEGLNKAYRTLSQVVEEERAATTTNARINDVMTEMITLRSRCEDDLERMKGQLRQNRIEIDDSRRQVSVIGDIQTAMAELNGNQKELASAVGGLQQSSIYISEWVQTLRGEAAELRALVTNVQQEQQRGSMALASDVATLAEDITGLRTKIDHQDSEMNLLREGVGSKVENVAVNVQRAVEAERKEVQSVLDAVKTAMKKQNSQNQHVLQTLHSGQQRVSTQLTDQIQVQGDKHRHIEAVVNKLESAFNLKTQEMSRGLEDHVSSIKRHLDANDQAVRLVTDMMSSSMAGRTINHNFADRGGYGESKLGSGGI
ncbi:hypothetical protein TL16_g02255 [Triparma laevis f. inornata]|uniref:Uncharacterized protein n=1 Tax=Triparma laevis f. inornata TaxID=1714386 RepID=A0A9W7DZZ5_9STRA|nr:hypothetical protein TL16_g02255 [Triparma laevis f. inornata]